jgi:hypothetical protein
MRCDECGCALAGFSVCSLSLNKSARPRVPRARKNSERLRTVCRAWTLVLSRHRFAPTWPLSQVLHVPHRQVTEALQSTFCNIKGKEKLPNYVECKFGIDWANDLWNVLLWLIRQFNKEIVCGKKHGERWVNYSWYHILSNGWSKIKNPKSQLLSYTVYMMAI